MENEIWKELLSFRDAKKCSFRSKTHSNQLIPKPFWDKNSLLRNMQTMFQNQRLSILSWWSNYLNSFFEENLVHGFLIEQIKDLEQSLIETEKYLLLIDNRATCDSFLPKIFSKYPDIIYKKVKSWIRSSHTYNC